MIPSAFKNSKIPRKTPLCTICVLNTREQTIEVQLTHDVTLWLCPAHASEEFRTMRSGRDFCTTVRRAWEGSGCLTRNRSKALDAHLARCQAPRRTSSRQLPGSYHWKALRNEVEHRAAAGERLRAIVLDLRERHADDVADAPSARTIRRWYHDGRWRDNVRTPLRKGYERRDPAKASRAQKDRAGIVVLREGHAARASAPPSDDRSPSSARSSVALARAP